MRGSIIWRHIGAGCELDSARGNFKLRNLAPRIQSPVRQTVGAAYTRPVVGNKDSIGADRFHHQSAKREIIAARGHSNPVAFCDSVLFGEPRMQFRTPLWILVDQRTDAPRLRA